MVKSNMLAGMVVVAIIWGPGILVNTIGVGENPSTHPALLIGLPTLVLVIGLAWKQGRKI